MELLQYWKVIQKSLWLVLLIVALGLSVTTAYTVAQPAEYESGTTLLLNPSVPSQLVPYVQTQVAANLADSYTQLMRTRSFADAVVRELSFPMSADDVTRAITTRLRPNTLFYDVTVRADDPDKAQQLVTAVLKVFTSANADQQRQQAGSDSGTADSRSQMRKRLEDKLKYLGDQIKSYQEQITTLEGQASSQERDTRLLQLRDYLVSLQQTETDTIVAISQLGSDAALLNSFLVIDQPLPGRLVPSRLPTNLALALAVSLLLGIGVAFLRDYLDYTIHSPEYLEEVLGLTPMAAIGTVGASDGFTYAYGKRRNRKAAQANEPDGTGPSHTLVTLAHGKSPESESFRVLRTNIQFSSLDKPIKSLVVTSAAPGEGKSFTASNLAIVMAQAGKRVILVDADLRKPSLHRVFELPNIVGFTNLILDNSNEAVIQRAMQPVPQVNDLVVVTSGPLPPNPSELLNSHLAVEVMAHFAQQADMVIYDTPPAAAVTDAVILATRADAVVLVINAGSTRRDMIARVKQSLQNVGVAAVLPVLNRVKARDLQGYYYYHYSYGGDTPHIGSNGNGQYADGKIQVTRKSADTESSAESSEPVERS